MEEAIYNTLNKPTKKEKSRVIDFLFEHLEEYGDPREDIEKAVDYALKEIPSFGGFVLEIAENDDILGAVVINHTGMSGYIPENILVYIAVHSNARGRGIGKKLMEKAKSVAKGSIALHVEHDNPARFLYEKVGFTNPYLEMRLKR